MSISSAKVTELGILIGSEKKKTIIVPLQIVAPKKDPYKSVTNLFSKRIFSLLTQYFNRYTLIYNKINEDSFEIQLLIYYSLFLGKKSVPELKQALQLLKDLFVENGFKISLINPKTVLDILTNRIPLEIIEHKSPIFQIKTEHGQYYLAIAKFLFSDKPDKSALFSFLKDFLVISPIGRLNIDVINSKKKIKDTYQKISEVAITLSLENSTSEELKLGLKKILPIINILTQSNQNSSSMQISLIDKQELLDHFGQIIFGQGWKHFITNSDEILDFDLLLFPV